VDISGLNIFDITFRLFIGYSKKYSCKNEAKVYDILYQTSITTIDQIGSDYSFGILTKCNQFGNITGGDTAVTQRV
jgi:hypothetical protein